LTRRIPLPKVINFDLDGTIVNVERRFHRAFNGARSGLGLHELPHEEFYRRYKTGGLSGDLNPERVEAFWRDFLDRFCFQPGDHLGDLFPGVPEALDRIRALGAKTSIITNRSAENHQVEAELEALGIRHHFDLVLSQGSFHFKNGRKNASWCKSTMIHHAADHFGVKAGQMAMVGDLSHDIASARTAGCSWAVAVRSGGSPVADLENAGPDAIIDSVADLPGHLASE